MPAATDSPALDPRAAPDQALAFQPPYERDGVTVIPAAVSRTHTARSGARGSSPGSGLDAQLGGTRALGAFVITNGSVRWRPAVDVTRVITVTEIVVGAVLVANRVLSRPPGTTAKVTMGPGGWVSMKGGAMAVRPARRIWRRLGSHAAVAPQPRRPVWARLLAAKTLQSLVS